MPPVPVYQWAEEADGIHRWRQPTVSSDVGGRLSFALIDRMRLALQIEEDKGEKYFCSEEEAVKAGWRPARP